MKSSHCPKYEQILPWIINLGQNFSKIFVQCDDFIFSFWNFLTFKVSFFVQCIKKQLITPHNFNIQTCLSHFLWFFSLKFCFKGQIISRICLILPNAYKLMCFDRNINGKRDVKFLEYDYLRLQQCKKLTLVGPRMVSFQYVLLTRSYG